MTEYSEAIALLRNIEFARASEIIDLDDALGRTLSADIVAHEASPPFDNSAMDGFALASVLTQDATPESPILLPVTRCLAAGDAGTGAFSTGAAIEIMTGAPLPEGDCDTVVKIEDVHVTRDSKGQATSISFDRPVRADQNIRRCGEDFQLGQVLLKAGQTVELSHLMALATMGITNLKVSLQPKIGLISTGKELVPPNTQQLRPGQIRNSTAIYVRKYLEALKFDLIDGGTVDDDPQNFRARLEQCLHKGAQILISTGAVSMGQFDFVRPTLEAMGAKIHFHKCAIRPGKPILFASLNWMGREVYFFGVPGNPVATAVGLRFFVRPFLDHCLGRRVSEHGQARLMNDFKKPEGLRCFYKAVEKVNTNGERSVEVLPGQASFMVGPLIKANSWAIFEESNNMAKAGSIVEVHSL